MKVKVDKMQAGEGEKENAKHIKTRYVERQGRPGEREYARRRSGRWGGEERNAQGDWRGGKVLQVEGTAWTKT